MYVLPIVIVLVIALIFVLLYLERRRHDLNDLKGDALGAAPRPEPDEDLELYLTKVAKQVETFDSGVVWRRSFIVALIAAFVIIVAVKKRAPTAIEYIFAVLVIFVLTYFTYQWYQAHFIKPNVRNIVADLNLVRDRVLRGEIKKIPQVSSYPT